MMRRIVIGVMGAGEEADAKNVATAFDLGRGIAERGWVLHRAG
jgi:hypothetical protein